MDGINNLGNLLDLLNLGALLAQMEDLRRRVDRNNRNILRNNRLSRTILGGLQQIRQMNLATLGRLGPRIRGGLSSVLVKAGKAVGSVFVRLGKFIDWAVVDRVLALMNLAIVMHNAWMLSRNVIESIGDLMSVALQVVGITNAEGMPLDVNQMVGQGVNQMLTRILGAQRLTNTKATIAKWSRLYQATANILWSVTSMFDSAREIAEWTAENTGKIGNALKRAGVVFENSYRWMAEKVNAASVAQRRYDRMIEGLDAVDDAASSLSMVLFEVRSIQEEMRDLKQRREEFDKALKEVQADSARAQNQPALDKHNQARTESRVNPANEQDLEPDPPVQP